MSIYFRTIYLLVLKYGWAVSSYYVGENTFTIAMHRPDHQDSVVYEFSPTSKIERMK